MSIGRPDYNLKVVPTPQDTGDYQEVWNNYEADYVAASNTKQFLITVVPSTYQLKLTQVNVSVFTPCRIKVSISYGAVVLYAGYFSGILSLKADGISNFVIAAGSTMIITVTNYDDYQNHCIVQASGYKQYI